MIVETSVLVPTLEDAPTLATTLRELNNVIVATGVATEVIVVDAGSRDGTLAIASQMADELPLLHIRILVQDRTQPGFGRLIRLGTAYAQGRHCFIVMPDGRDPLEQLPRMLGELRRGAHLVLCSRYEEDAGSSGSQVPARFRAYQALYRRAIRVGLGEDIPDSTYGFRGFNRTFLQALGLTSSSFAVCPEITFKVMLAGGEVRRVPGAQAAPMLHQQSKFRLHNELAGYLMTLVRASLHRSGLRWF